MNPIGVWVKRFISVLFLLYSILNIEAQNVVKYTACSVSYRRVLPKESSTDWSEHKDVNILVVLNLEKERLSIYSKKKQEYDFISDAEEVVSENGRKSLCFDCVDEEGEGCVVLLWYEEGYGCTGITIIQGVYAVYYDLVLKD